MRKAAFINYSLFGGGAERNAINLSQFLNGHSFHSDILIFKDVNDYVREYPDLATAHIIPVFETKGTIPLPLKPFYAVLLLQRLYRLVAGRRYDILIAAEEYAPFFITVLLARLTGKKSLLLVGNNITEELALKPWPVFALNMVMFSLSFYFADHIICVSEGLRRNLVRRFPIKENRITTVYNGVNRKAIQKKCRQKLTRKEEGYFKNGPTVVALGRLVYKKGFEHLIRAFAIVKKSVPEARLIMIGKGPLRLKLAALARELNIGDDVIFCGFHEDNPYRILGRADVFAFTSLYEGFGNTLVEAMNCGIPVISTACPYGPEEIIGRKYGVLVPAISPGDNRDAAQQKEAVLAKEIIRLLTDKDRAAKYKAAGLLRAESFTLDIMGKKYGDLIDTLTGKP